METVYVAGPADDRWAFWNGRVFRITSAARRTTPPAADAHQILSAPMPATVAKVLTSVGARVTKGTTLIVLEAMKMELPLRAAGDATVTAIHCKERDLVQPDTPLIELS